MKAEHRKELETNVLADRVGKLVQTVKSGPSGRFMLYAILAVAAVVVLWIFLRSRSLARDEVAQQWLVFEDGSPSFLEGLTGKDETAKSNAGKAARFQEAYRQLWNDEDLGRMGGGLKYLGLRPAQVLRESLPRAKETYEQLAEECKNDPVWLPEALHALAVIEETKAIEDVKHLDAARTLYQELADKHPKSAYGELASQRAELLGKNRAEIVAIYQELHRNLKVQQNLLEWQILKSARPKPP